MSCVAVIGGGLAGIAAAVRLAEAGLRPVVIESRRKLGGRATSFVDPRTGERLDNCQHVVMGCCTNLLDLYWRLGVLERIQWHEATHWANPPHAPDTLRPGWLPAPSHFTFAFLRMRLLTTGEKLRVARAMWRLIRMGLAGRERWRGRTFAAFLQQTGQPARAIERFWEPVVVSACNLPCDRVDAPFAMQVFQEGFLGNSFASAMGLSDVPLVDLYDPAEAILARSGGTVRLGLSALALAFDGRRVTGVVTDEGLLEASAVVSTVPFDRLARLCSDALRQADRRLRDLDGIGVSPIVGVHLRYPARVLETPHLVLPGRATQWLFDKGIDASGRQHVHAVISGAEAWMDLPEAEIAARVHADVQWACPAAAGLAPLEARSVKERRATFAAEPGFAARRPGPRADARGGVDNLFLAGDWCDTGWPATMEGAVRSGYAAAAAITGQGGVLPDLPISLPARLLGLR
jgi:zeta-carotene desaturase